MQRRAGIDEGLWGSKRRPPLSKVEMMKTPIPRAHAAATAAPFPPSGAAAPSAPPQPSAPAGAVPEEVYEPQKW